MRLAQRGTDPCGPRKTKARRLPLVALAAVSLLVAGCASGTDAEPDAGAKSSEQQVSMEGKTIRILVPFGPGGGADVAARLMSKMWAAEIPGKPTVIVENLPGAGGALGMSALMKEDSDGTTVAMITPGIMARWLTKTEGHSYPLEGMRAIGATSGTVVTATRASVAKTAEELLKRNKPFVSGHERPDGTGPLIEKISADLLGLKLKQNFGFEGYGEVALAVERGELEGSTPSANDYVEKFEKLSGGIVPLMQMGQADDAGGVKRNAAFPDVPTVLEVYKQINGSDASGPSVDIYNALVKLNSAQFAAVVRPETPEPVVKALVAAFDAMVKTPEWDKQSSAAFGSAPGILSAGSIEGLLKELSGFSPAVIDYVKASQKS
jgi:hypothetical protein